MFTIHLVWNQTLDLIFPRQNIFQLEPELALQLDHPDELLDLTAEYQDLQHLSGVFVATDYHLLHSFIHDFKYRYQPYLAKQFGQLVLPKLESYLHNFPQYCPDVLTYCPTDPGRQLRRGYNPSELIALELAANLQLPLVDLFQKNSSTPTQAKISRAERLHNLDGKINLLDSFDVHQRLMSIKNVWIVDDVLATGSTLDTLASLITTKYPFVKVYGLALARNLD